MDSPKVYLQVGIACFTHFARQAEQGHKLMSHPCQTPTQAATTDSMAEVTLFGQKRPAQRLIATKLQCRHDPNRHDLRITPHTLRIVPMMLPFQQIVTQTVYEYTACVDGVLRSLFSFAQLNSNGTPWPFQPTFSR